MTFWQWLREQLLGAQLSEAELHLLAGSQERAEAEHAEAQRRHDETGEHVWLDVTSHSDTVHHYRCGFCRAELLTAHGEAINNETARRLSDYRKAYLEK